MQPLRSLPKVNVPPGKAVIPTHGREENMAPPLHTRLGPITPGRLAFILPASTLQSVFQVTLFLQLRKTGCKLQRDEKGQSVSLRTVTQSEVGRPSHHRLIPSGLEPSAFTTVFSVPGVPLPGAFSLFLQIVSVVLWSSSSISWATLVLAVGRLWALLARA